MSFNEACYLAALRRSDEIIYLGDPSAASRVSSVASPDGSEFVAINDARPADGPAIFSCIGTMSSSFFSLNSHGGFDPERKKPWEVGVPDVECLAGVRGRGFLVPPPHGLPECRRLYLDSVNNLQTIASESSPTGSTFGLFDRGPPGSVRLVHKFFEPLESEHSYCPPFSMETWPLPHHLEHLRAPLSVTHAPEPINVIVHRTQEVVLPGNYTSVLPGAVMDARFSLWRKPVTRRGEIVNCFIARIEELLVLYRGTDKVPTALQARSRPRFTTRDSACNQHYIVPTKRSTRRQSAKNNGTTYQKRTTSE